MPPRSANIRERQDWTFPGPEALTDGSIDSMSPDEMRALLKQLSRADQPQPGNSSSATDTSPDLPAGTPLLSFEGYSSEAESRSGSRPVGDEYATESPGSGFGDKSAAQSPEAVPGPDSVFGDFGPGSVFGDESDLVTGEEQAAEPLTRSEDLQALNSEQPGKRPLEWVSDPRKAKLRRFMGIGADLDRKVQSERSRDLRHEVRMSARIDYTKTWTELANEGRTDQMITGGTHTPS
jgi:hypothetical protein